MEILCNKMVLEEIDRVKSQMLPFSPIICLKYEIEEMALNYLGLQDMYQLRDRFEGNLYLQNFKNRVLSIKAVEYYLSKEIVDWKEIKEKPNLIFKRNITAQISYEVVPFTYDAFPKIGCPFQYPVICVFIRNDKSVYITGILTEEVFNTSKYFEDNLRFGSIDKTNKTLINLTCLKPMKGNLYE